MKKLLLAAVLSMVVALPVMAQTSPIKLSLWDGIEVPKAQTVKGLELGIGGKTETVYGVQAELIKGNANHVTGLQWGIYTQANEMVGLQSSVVGLADNVTGIQWGVVNLSDNHVSGAQLGFYNQAQSLTGLQFGFVNYAEELNKGLQIGLVNIAKNGWFPLMVIVNGRF